MKTRNSILRIILAVLCVVMLTPNIMAEEHTTRKQRNYIHSGNELYKQKRYAEAEVQYSKALEINPASEIALYNHAMSLLHQAQPSDTPAADNPLGMSLKTLQSLIEAENATVGEFAAYNLGNYNFGKEQYQDAIECYKRSL
ncbi:MAG: tetratricopeptide repeat protein, partial [Muribaculaceae bacterium]|nr:tetratricopeptide repeat protein [Muribaculaceae bacterium]